jgi:hypothetical protein
MTKRRFTHSAVAHTTHTGAPLAISGSTASWALPANTVSDISISGSGSPPLPMAMPVIRPQAPMPSAVPSISRPPRANSGSCHRRAVGDAVTHTLSWQCGQLPPD